MSSPLPLRAGIARASIDPEPGTALAGYATLRLRRSEGVRDPLTATALVLEDGSGSRVAILAVDQLAVHEDVVARVRAGAARAGLCPEAILVAASHSHSAPVASVLEGRTSPEQLAYVERFVERSVDALVRAGEGLAPATLARAVGQTDLIINRREEVRPGKVIIGVNREGHADRSIGIVQVRDAQGAPLAHLVNLACHPTFMSPKHKRSSAEWPGVMRRAVEEATGVPCLFLQGATGDQNPDHTWGDREEAQMEASGRAVAVEVLRALDGATPLAPGPVGAIVDTVWLEVVGEARRLGRGTMSYVEGLRRHTHLPLPAALVNRALDTQYPWRTGLVSDASGARVPLQIQALRAGGLAIVGQGAETFHGVGMAIKEASPAEATLFCGYSNGMIGYLPTREEHNKGGYEVDLVPYLYRLPGRLDPASAERAVAWTGELLAGLWSPAPPEPAIAPSR